MSLPKEITMTPDGGNYYRAMAFFYTFTGFVFLPVAVALLIAVLNPFWFRDGLFRFTESRVNSISSWRNYRMYAIYLGCDPKYWHTLKDTH